MAPSNSKPLMSCNSVTCMYVYMYVWAQLYSCASSPPHTGRYACSWRRLSPSTDGMSGEIKDLWVFYFTDLPNIMDTLSEELKGKASPPTWRRDGVVGWATYCSYCSCVILRVLMWSSMKLSNKCLGMWCRCLHQYARCFPTPSVKGVLSHFPPNSKTYLWLS